MSKNVKNYLFARPSFIGGMSQVLDIGANFQDYNYTTSSREADTRALLNDWFAIGDDFRHAIKEYDRTLRK